MSEKQLEKLYYSIYPMNQCETQSKSYEETKELCETLEKEMISLMRHLRPARVVLRFQAFALHAQQLACLSFCRAARPRPCPVPCRCGSPRTQALRTQYPLRTG